MPRFVGQTGGFNARVLLNTLLNVTVLSILLTIIGNWIGTKQIGLEPFRTSFTVGLEILVWRCGLSY
jgi:hypothetical protein